MQRTFVLMTREFQADTEDGTASLLIGTSTDQNKVTITVSSTRSFRTMFTFTEEEWDRLVSDIRLAQYMAKRDTTTAQEPVVNTQFSHIDDIVPEPKFDDNPD